MRERMVQDFEIGDIIVDECVPYSLEYYLGVKAEGEDDDIDDDDETMMVMIKMRGRMTLRMNL
jgi:hypothetical protein